jgi:hypothetical protein
MTRDSFVVHQDYILLGQATVSPLICGCTVCQRSGKSEEKDGEEDPRGGEWGLTVLAMRKVARLGHN